MRHKSSHHSLVAHSDQPLIDYAGLTDSLTRHVDHKLAANESQLEAQLKEERQVNPLWMITAALAVLFVLGTLLMFE